MMPYMTFQEEVQNFSTSLTCFVKNSNLPMELFVRPDHLALKARDRDDFDKLTVAWSQHALGGVVRAIDMDERTLASLQLTQPIAVEPFGHVEWLEIMEPRAQKIGKGVVGLEHMEFSVLDLDEASRILLRY